MSERHEDIGYLTALGHTAIAIRQGLVPDAIHDPESYGVDAVTVGVDLFAVRAQLGWRSVGGWWAHYSSPEAFTGGMSVATKSLLLAARCDLGMPQEYVVCIACDDEGCDECHDLGCVPSDMVCSCPACGGDGYSPRGGRCHFCHGKGSIWESDRQDVIDADKDGDDWRDYEAATRRSQEGGTL